MPMRGWHIALPHTLEQWLLGCSGFHTLNPLAFKHIENGTPSLDQDLIEAEKNGVCPVVWLTLVL